jgi:hypothetical protein
MILASDTYFDTSLYKLFSNRPQRNQDFFQPLCVIGHDFDLQLQGVGLLYFKE